MKKIFLFIFSLLFLGTILLSLSQNVALAADDDKEYSFINATEFATDSGEKAGFVTTENLEYAVIAGIINVLLGLVGIIFVSLFIFAGITWMSSRGQEDKISKAKNVLTYAIIGLMVVVGGYSLSTFIGSTVQLGGSVSPTRIDDENAGGSGDQGNNGGGSITPSYLLPCDADHPNNCCKNPSNSNPGDRCIDFNDCRGTSAEGTTDCYPSVCCRGHLDCTRHRTKSTCNGSSGAFSCQWSYLFQNCTARSN